VHGLYSDAGSTADIQYNVLCDALLHGVFHYAQALVNGAFALALLMHVIRSYDLAQPHVLHTYTAMLYTAM
jgi:hypothetical protein